MFETWQKDWLNPRMNDWVGTILKSLPESDIIQCNTDVIDIQLWCKPIQPNVYQYILDGGQSNRDVY